MDDRKELIDILCQYFGVGDSYHYVLNRVKEAFAIGTMGFDDFKEYDEETVSEIVDHLISNGVRLQRWIPVTERLPQNKNSFEEYIVRVNRSYFPTSSYDSVDSPYEEQYTTAAMFDRDQKVWHLSRSDVVLNALIMPEDSCLNGECVIEWAELPASY